MEWLLFGVLFLLANGMVLYFALNGVEYYNPINAFKGSLLANPTEKACLKEKRLTQQLLNQKRRLKRQLETLGYVSNLEFYLKVNPLAKNKSVQLDELKALKLMAQEGVLDAVREIVDIKTMIQNT